MDHTETKFLYFTGVKCHSLVDFDALQWTF